MKYVQSNNDVKFNIFIYYWNDWQICQVYLTNISFIFHVQHTRVSKLFLREFNYLNSIIWLYYDSNITKLWKMFKYQIKNSIMN
jgi:hypothetical protein